MPQADCRVSPETESETYIGAAPYQSQLGQGMHDIHFITGLPGAYRLIHIMERPKDFLLTYHAHKWYHINYLFTGSVDIFFQGKVLTAHQGEVFILPPYIPHQLSSKTGYSQLGIDVVLADDSRGISRMVQQTFGQEAAVIGIPARSRTFGELYEIAIGRSDFDILRLVNFSEQMLYDLIEIRREGGDSSFKRDFQEMLQSLNPCSTSLQQMADWLGFSKAQLERLCRREFGCGAMEYCAKLKCARCCLLLQTSDKNLREIAEELSFYDESHFSVFFRRCMGVTPGQYRRNFRKQNGRVELVPTGEAAAPGAGK